MNISCGQCGGRFSIVAEQLGGCGSCPHCLATIVLPREKTDAPKEFIHLRSPRRWLEFVLIGIGAVGIHLLLLLLFAKIPWNEFRAMSPVRGEMVLIDPLPRQTLSESADGRLESLPVDSLLGDAMSEARASRWAQPIAKLQEKQGAGAGASASLSSAGREPLSLELTDRANLLDSAEEDFEDLLVRLKKDGLDIVITFDSSGSMQGEIDEVKDQIERIGDVLFQLVPKTRISICTYRDQGDAYVVKGLPLTDNLGEVVLYLKDIQAAGGGDDPEAVDAGLRWSIENNNFRRRARKVVLLFGDAPPRASRLLQCQKMVSDFRNVGGVVSTVTCRKSNRMDAFISIAQIGQGESFLTEDEQQIMSQLIVLVFGSQYRMKVLEAFDLLEPGLGR